MNNKKMTTDEFIQKKEEIINLVNKYNALVPELLPGVGGYIKYPPETVIREEKNKLEKQFIEKINNILSYDLSDIPFEDWENFETINLKEKLDFSKTRANIDFKLIEIKCKGNFKGCNIKNLSNYYYVYINEELFDDKTIKENPNVFLPNYYSKEFKEKYYNMEITVKDLSSFTKDKIQELDRKYSLMFHFDTNEYNFVERFGIEKIIDIYNYSQDLFNKLYVIIENKKNYYQVQNADLYGFRNELTKKIKECEDLSKINSMLDNFLRKAIEYSIAMEIDINKYPKEFVDKNKDLFLIDIDLPDEIKKRYLKRELSDKDIYEYIDKFDFVPIELFSFYGGGNLIQLKDSYGIGNIQKLIKKHKDVFKHFIYENPLDIPKLHPTIDERALDFEEKFESVIKNYYKKSCYPRYYKNEKYFLPDWIKSMNFTLIQKITNIDQLKNYSNKTILFNTQQLEVIKALRIENLLKLEESTNYFSHNQEGKMGNLELLGEMINEYFFYPDLDQLIDYDRFEKYFAKCLNLMRKRHYFYTNPDYNFIEGKFRIKYSYLFMDKNAPQELYDAFFLNRVSLDFLNGHFEYIPFLLDKDLSDLIEDNCDAFYYDQELYKKTLKLIKSYSKKYGNEGILNLICKYGYLLEEIANIKQEIDETKEETDYKITEAIYNAILINQKISYSFLNEDDYKVPEFVENHPDIFIDFESIPMLDNDEEKDYIKKQEIYDKFYNKSLKIKDIYNYPQLKKLFKDKDTRIVFGRYFNEDRYRNLKILILYTSNDMLFDLCLTYGKFLEYLGRSCIEEIVQYKTLDVKKRIIEKSLAESFIIGRNNYGPEDSPKFLKEKHPELFLDENAPENLSLLFYNYNKGDNLTFEKLAKNKDWLKYLKNKSAVTSFLRNFDYNTTQYLQTKLYFEIFGQDKALKLGIYKAETIEKMIKAEQAEKIKIWYDSTGEKFIPDYVVMQNFPLEQIDKFLKASSIWSKLMKIERYSNNEEGRDALLKLAYAFGVFDNDQKGINQLFELLNKLPKTITNESIEVIDYIDKGYRAYKDKIDSLKVYQKKHYNILLTLKQENFETDVEKGIMSSIYVQKDKESDKLYLNIDPQKYPKASILIREELESKEKVRLLNPKKAHQLFGGFNLIYDKDFKDFLIENLDEILSNPDYTNKIANIQKQFRDIKIANSNRKLTLDLAISYIQENQYTDVEVGNEEVAEISAIAGYSQSDFDTLQLIYNFGKQRVFSSIPRIKNEQDKYNYEILRLDDPLALAIGTLTDCCQQIGDVAEMCVEHSMVDKNGRVFVIKDDVGNIISQSWVWRNKNTLCFDNIEIPDKVFSRISKENKDKKEFTTEVYNIYKKAAQELIEIDEQKYKELLEDGKITKEQYEGLKLSKVTVGLGYNDIAESINEHAKKDNKPAKTLGFKSPIKLNHSLYTSDSEVQYVLEEKEAQKPYNGKTLSLYNDELKIYTKDNFNEKELLKLKKLEIVTKGDIYDLVTELYDEPENYMSELADNCELDEEKIKVIMNPNFAIIYEEDEGTIKIGEIFYNTQVNNKEQKIDITEKVLLQLKLALEELTKDKTINIDLLDEKQKKFYLKSVKINKQLDIERGINNARKNK